MLGDGGGDQLQLPHVWKGGWITDILQEAWPEDCITKVMVLSPRGSHSILWQVLQEWLPYHRARDIKVGLGSPFNWAGRSVQIEALRKNHAGRLPCHP